MEGLTHFRTIVYRHRITSHTDHKNLTYANSDYSSDRILRQRLVIEKYGADIKCIPGIKNTAVDTLSRIPTRAQPDQENFALGDKITEGAEGFTLNLNHIVDEQKTCPDLIERLQLNKGSFAKRTFETTEFVYIVDERDDVKAKIYVPRMLRDPWSLGFTSISTTHTKMAHEIQYNNTSHGREC